MNKITILFFISICLHYGCNPNRALLVRDHCNVINEILFHPEINRILGLDQKQYQYSQIRIFFLQSDAIGFKCNGVVRGWRYQTYDEIRPSINTGYHRDIFIKIKKGNVAKIVYEVYLASHITDNFRQTTYLLEFAYPNSNDHAKIKLVGFSEYTDN